MVFLSRDFVCEITADLLAEIDRLVERLNTLKNACSEKPRNDYDFVNVSYAAVAKRASIDVWRALSEWRRKMRNTAPF